MARIRTTYSLKEIFTKLLEDSEKNCFMIPTYQRGYKWTSIGENSQVEILMRDLINAYKSSNTNRYYLQFLTLKENDDQLEVIDGQQRLTTLTILFCLLDYIKSDTHEEKFIQNKLIYQTRENFIKKYIYEDLKFILKSDDWSVFVENHPDHNNQDVFYIYHATKVIYEKITTDISEDLHEFYEYLCDQVILIVNLLERINSEKIFINVNKGVKLNDIDLVKGLLITKIPLDNQNTNYHLHENEINELRVNIGKQWDDLIHWTSRKDITDFFKIDTNISDPLSWLIQLKHPAIHNKNNLYPIFNFLDSLYRAKEKSTIEIFDEIRKTMLILDDWFNEPEICNLLGYIIHTSNSKGISFVWEVLENFKTKSEILLKLKTMCKDILPINNDNEELQELNYEDFKQKIFDLFLMLDVAKFLPIGDRNAIPYDFSQILSENWSIEHIFPQNAQYFSDLSKDDLLILKKILPKSLDELSIENNDNKESIKLLFKKIKTSKENCKILDEEKELFQFLLEKSAGDLHRLGNLALLQRELNSGFSNHFFDNKRKKLVQKVSEGKFVPYHTYDVFSKLIINTQTGLHSWSKADIIKHEEYIKTQISLIVEYLNI